MANMELITSVTVGAGGAASVTLPGTGTIPQTYTDLKVVFSTRCSGSGDFRMYVYPNGSTTNLASQNLYGTGTGVSGVAYSGGEIGFGVTPNNTTGSTFGSGEIYFTDYTSTTRYKSFSLDGASENNGSNAYSSISAGYWSNNSAITTLVLQPTSGNWMEGSTFYLYGISNVTYSPKATGGIVSQDATYWYHMFPFTSTFTPTQAITADVLVIAGGGAGGFGNGGGGGGAGGYRTTLDTSAVSLSTSAYTVTVGAGGPCNFQNIGQSGSNSSFAGSGITTITSTGGGAGSSDYSASNGLSGGSGGGGMLASTVTRAPGSGNSGGYTPVEGYAGGTNSYSNGTYVGAGGGGAGAVGGNVMGVNGSGGGTGGSGGAGRNTNASWANATFTGINGYYAGGGGAGAYPVGSPSGPGLGGLGGGGKGGNPGTNGITNTGSGGGGASGNPAAYGGNGGSGIVIVRYAK